MICCCYETKLSSHTEWWWHTSGGIWVEALDFSLFFFWFGNNCYGNLSNVQGFTMVVVPFSFHCHSYHGVITLLLAVTFNLKFLWYLFAKIRELEAENFGDFLFHTRNFWSHAYYLSKCISLGVNFLVDLDSLVCCNLFISNLFFCSCKLKQCAMK